MEKKVGALMHLEIILSFIIFFSFVLFLLLFIKPYNQNALSDALLISLESSFDKNVSTNLTKIFLKENTNKACFSVDFDYIDPSQKSLAKNLSESLIPSYFSANKININNPDTSKPKFFYLYFSEEFNAGPAIACDLSSDFEIGSVEKKILVSDKKMQKLKNEYDNKYVDLKKEFKIPNSLDFAIASKGYLNLEKEIPLESEVIARTYTKDVLFEDGTIKPIQFTFKVW
ncbi:MAG: hypothetical protein ACOYT4_01925 [Nanoarchaeota archaeon]